MVARERQTLTATPFSARSIVSLICCPLSAGPLTAMPASILLYTSNHDYHQVLLKSEFAVRGHHDVKGK